MRIQKVKIAFFMIFTIMFKITICKSTFTKLTDKMLQGFVEVLDFIAKIVKSHTIKYLFFLLSTMVKHA